MPSCGFQDVLEVERRSLIANEPNNHMRLGLSDLNSPTTNDARAVAEYLEAGFGLFVDAYGDVA